MVCPRQRRRWGSRLGRGVPSGGRASEGGGPELWGPDCPGPQPQFPHLQNRNLPPGVCGAGGLQLCSARVEAGPRMWPTVAVVTAVKGAGCAWNAAVCLRLLCDTHTLPGLFSNGVLFASASERTGSPASPLPANLGGGTEASKISLLRPPPILRGSLLCCPRSPFEG